MIRLNQVRLFESIYLTGFNYFDHDVPFTLRVEYGEIYPQSNSGEYDWLVSNHTWNTRGRYIPIIPLVLITPTPYGPAWRFYPCLSWYNIIHILHGGYYSLYMSRCPPPPMIRGIKISYGYHILYLYKLYLVTWGSAYVKKMTQLWKTSHVRRIWINVNVSACMHTLCPRFDIIKKYITGDNILKSSCIFL